MNFIITYLIIIAFAAVSIYFFRKKKFEYWFCSIYMLLPDYFALEINESLPLISADRIMILLFFLYVIINYRHLAFQKIITNHKISIPLSIYFICRLATNLRYVTTYGSSAKAILALCFEQLFLLVLLVTVFHSREKIERAFVFMSNASGIVFLFGIFESITGRNVAYYLYTASRKLLFADYHRLGLRRSTFTLGIPSFFGTYCVLMLPILLHVYRKTKEKKYFVILILQFFALLHCGSRAPLFVYFFILFLSLLEKERKTYLKQYVSFLGISLALIVALSFVSEHLRYYYTGTAKSLLNVVGFEFDLNEGAPKDTAGFGSNEDGSYSRLAQFSGIPYVLSKEPVFGFGYGAQNRDDVQYFYMGRWRILHTYDVGYVAITMDEGLLGVAGYLALLIGLLLLLFQKSNKKPPLLYHYVFGGYLLCLFANSLYSNFFWLMFGILLSWISNTSCNQSESRLSHD